MSGEVLPPAAVPEKPKLTPRETEMLARLKEKTDEVNARVNSVLQRGENIVQIFIDPATKTTPKNWTPPELQRLERTAEKKYEKEGKKVTFRISTRELDDDAYAQLCLKDLDDESPAPRTGANDTQVIFDALKETSGERPALPTGASAGTNPKEEGKPKNIDSANAAAEALSRYMRRPRT